MPEYSMMSLSEKMGTKVQRYKEALKILNEYHLNILLGAPDVAEQFEYLKRHSDITKLMPATGYLRKRQLENTAYAKKLFDELENKDIYPFLYSGNLIGAVRHGGFIPWDDDMDFGLMRSEYNNLLDYFREKYVVITPRSKKDYVINYRYYIKQWLSEYKYKYILVKLDGPLQIIGGTSCFDFNSVELYPFDFYKDNVDFERYRVELKNMRDKFDGNKYIDDYIERIRIIEESIEECDILLKTGRSNTVFNTIGNASLYPIISDNFSKWISYKTLFPLKKIKYENEYFYAPNESDAILDIFYSNYREYPKDFASPKHRAATGYSLFTNVEFCVTDTKEISFFSSLYDECRRHDIYAIYVVDSKLVNDYYKCREIIDMIDKYQMEYRTHCNCKATYAISGYSESILKRYKRNKVCISIQSVLSEEIIIKWMNKFRSAKF